VTDTTNPNPAPPSTTAAPSADIVARLEGETKILAEKLAAANARVGEFASQVSTLTSANDTFKASMAALESRAAKADELAVMVTDMTNAKHEASLVDALRAKLPGADPLAIRGVLGELHKAGKVNRFATDTAAELARAAVINVEAPSPPPPTSGGGLRHVSRRARQRRPRPPSK
jgi:hypothetical protein